MMMAIGGWPYHADIIILKHSQDPKSGLLPLMMLPIDVYKLIQVQYHSSLLKELTCSRGDQQRHDLEPVELSSIVHGSVSLGIRLVEHMCLVVLGQSQQMLPNNILTIVSGSLSRCYFGSYIHTTILSVRVLLCPHILQCDRWSVSIGTQGNVHTRWLTTSDTGCISWPLSHSQWRYRVKPFVLFESLAKS